MIIWLNGAFGWEEDDWRTTTLSAAGAPMRSSGRSTRPAQMR